jgi:hypothetical protein
MEMNIRGNLILEKNPIFADPTQTIGNNRIRYMLLSCFEEEDIKKFKHIIINTNHGKPIEHRMSFPIGFDKTPNGAYAVVMCKFRNPKSDTLLKRIAFESNLRSVPLRDWIGKEFIIRVKIYKYNYVDHMSGSGVLAGGSSVERKGYTYHIKSIKLSTE